MSTFLGFIIELSSPVIAQPYFYSLFGNTFLILLGNEGIIRSYLF